MVLADTKPLPVPVFFLVAAPWDLSSPSSQVDCRALGETLDRLHGEVGITGLSIWGASPPCREFRAQKAPHWFQCEGGLYFDPVQNHGGCRPPEVSSVARSALSEIAAACQQHNVPLRLLLSLARLGGLAQYYPEFASRNAFGDMSHTSICLLKSAVQQCMRSIACAVPPQFAVRQVVLHDVLLGWLEAFETDVRWPARLGPVEQTMLSTCFCPCCVRSADETGLEVEAARTAVTALISHSLTNGTCFGGTAAGFLVEHPALDSYRRLQIDRLNAFLREIMESSPREVLVARHSTQDCPIDPEIPAGVVTDVASLSDAGQSMCSGARRNEVTVPASCLLGSGKEEFVGATSNLPRWGCTGVQIDGLACLPESSWTTLKQAIRFARRSFAL